MMFPGLLLLLFSGRLNWQIREGFLWLMLSMGMWVVKTLKHLPPFWFIASALSLQMPTLWSCLVPPLPPLGHAQDLAMKPSTPGTVRALQALAPDFCSI